MKRKKPNLQTKYWTFNSIEAISKIMTEDGKQKVAVYVVLDNKENINQQAMFDAIDAVSEKHEKTSRFLLKTF